MTPHEPQAFEISETPTRRSSKFGRFEVDIQAEYAAMARRAGELAPDEPLRPTLLEFAELVVGMCAEIGQHYGDWDRQRWRSHPGRHVRRAWPSPPTSTIAG